ncbi:hypothetical protein M378DRAFT_759132 [Amanita muscaria Koide BX008]|uniref:Uncharacterized protein n=1 Tax=Amanita muscaria (strain Koide BX008) TaxID=946122 RepID=A0A0C2WEQ9_AMAMK|nr:hypothetical protein M378DRAFT_759132 [Amanita muscaria Koide BX008]
MCVIPTVFGPMLSSGFYLLQNSYMASFFTRRSPNLYIKIQYYQHVQPIGDTYIQAHRCSFQQTKCEVMVDGHFFGYAAAGQPKMVF